MAIDNRYRVPNGNPKVPDSVNPKDRGSVSAVQSDVAHHVPARLPPVTRWGSCRPLAREEVIPSAACDRRGAASGRSGTRTHRPGARPASPPARPAAAPSRPWGDVIELVVVGLEHLQEGAGVGPHPLEPVRPELHEDRRPVGPALQQPRHPFEDHALGALGVRS